MTDVPDFGAYITQLESLNIVSCSPFALLWLIQQIYLLWLPWFCLQEDLKDQIAALQDTVGLLELRMDNPARFLLANLNSIRGTYNQLAEELNKFSSELDRTVPNVSFPHLALSALIPTSLLLSSPFILIQIASLFTIQDRLTHMIDNSNFHGITCF